jgi:hypothetical protein
MRKIALFYLTMASMGLLSTAAIAETVAAPTPPPAVIRVGYVGIGTPDCHQQGVLFRFAHHCPEAAIADAVTNPPIRYINPPRPHYLGHRQKHASARS